MKINRLRTDRRAFAELLKVVDDHERSAGKTAFDNPAIAILRAERDIVHMHRVVGCDGVDLFLALKLCDRNLRNQNCAVKSFGLGFNSSELAGAKDVTRIGNAAAMRIAPVCEFNCLSTKTT